MIAAFALLFFATAWRIYFGINHQNDYAWLHNFAPLSAIALCGAAWLPRRVAFTLPLVALFISDLALNYSYQTSLLTWEMAIRYVALAIIALGGWLLRGNTKRPGVMLGASVVASAVFFVLSNTASWITESGYPKNFSGWAQSQTTGLPGFPPSITFLKHTVASDLAFTAMFLACFAYARRTAPAAAGERLENAQKA